MQFSFKQYFYIFIFVILGFQLLGLFATDIVKVNERQVAVITRLGKVIDTKTAGWYFKVPYLDNVAALYDSAVQSVSAEAACATKDQQSINVKVNVQFRLDPTKAVDLFRTVKTQDYLNTAIIPPIIQETIKSKTAKYSAAELLDKRDLLKLDTENALSEKLKEYFSTVASVNIENIDFSEQFDRAIESKVIAEQQVQQKKQELEREKLEADVQITKAKGVAESTRIRGEALKANPETIEQAKVDKWDGKLPQVSGSNSIINLEKK
jgi:regulator of protease activity HflC (stomatin/prohibitin superfamily)